MEDYVKGIHDFYECYESLMSQTLQKAYESPKDYGIKDEENSL